MEHRGRLQAQGEHLEESESWAQNTPLTANEGINLLQQLWDKLSGRNKTIRNKPFNKAKKYIEQASENGGVSATVFASFNAKTMPKERIDIEVRKGKAFVPDTNTTNT